MVVARGYEGVDRDQAVAAGAVLDHDGMAAPACGQTVAQKTRSRISGAAGAERQDQPDIALRPGLGLDRRCPEGCQRASQTAAMVARRAGARPTA